MNQNKHLMKNAIILISLILLLGCSKEKDFMTSTSRIVVLNITHKDFFINEKKIGETFKDVHDNGDWLIESVKKEIWNIIPRNELKDMTAHVHISEYCSFGDFIKIMRTLWVSGIASTQFVIGDNFNKPIQLNRHDGVDNTQRCRNIRSNHLMNEILREKLGEKISHEERLQKSLDNKQAEIDCAEKYLSLIVNHDDQRNEKPIMISLNEIGIVDGIRNYNFGTEQEVLDFLEKIKERPSLKNKKDRNEILFTEDENAPLSNSISLIQVLNEAGFEMSFAAYSRVSFKTLKSSKNTR